MVDGELHRDLRRLFEKVIPAISGNGPNFHVREVIQNGEAAIPHMQLQRHQRIEWRDRVPLLFASKITAVRTGVNDSSRFNGED